MLDNQYLYLFPAEKEDDETECMTTVDFERFIDLESNNLEAYLSFLRKKIKIIGSSVTIKAIRGLGYKLEVNNEKN